MARKDFEEYKKKNEPNRYHGGAGIKPSERVKTASERLEEKARQVEAQKRQREAQAAQVKQYEEKAAETRQNNLPLYGAVGGLYNKYGLSTGSQIVSDNAKRLEQREMQKQLAHATEMSDTYAQLYGSGKTTPSQKAEALEQRNRFDREAWAAQQRLDELGYVEPNSVFVPDYTELPMKPGFDMYSKMGADMETDIRPEEIEGSYTYYDLLSDEEQGVFNYLLATQGEESARNYMDFMRNTAQHRYGQRVAQGIEDSDWRTGALIANSLGTGVTNWMEGMLGAYGAATGQEVAENGLNYASPYIKENLGTVGNVAYDLGVAVGNMLPSVMLGGAAGNVSMGLSAGGNAYQQGIREGMSNSEALVYGTLIGTSEAYLQRAMGGISRLSGTKASKLDDALRGIENGFLRFISKTGVGMVKEGGEEALQAVLEPMFNSLITGSDVDIDWSEVAYNALMGALVGGVFEAPQNLVETTLTEGKDAMFAPLSENPQNFTSEGVMPIGNNVPAEAGNTAEIRPDSPGLVQARAQLRQSTFAAAKKSFGKEGYASFEAQAAAMDNPADNFGEMARAYNDGMVNRHAASYGNLSGAQYEAMFEAGKADAEASIASQMDKRNKVFSYKDAGIDMADAVTKEYSATLDARDAKTLNAAAKAFGLKIRFADSVAGGAANAEIRNGVITIEKGNPEPLRFLFGHEITHRMQELAPQEYARLREAVAERATDFRVDVADTIDNYRKHGKSIDPNDAVDEVVADEIGKILKGDENLERFIARFSGERTLLQKLRDIIHDIRVALVGTDAEKQLLRVEKRLTEAAKAASKQAQSNVGATKNAAQESDGRSAYSLKGYTADGTEVYETSKEVLAMPWAQRKRVFREMMSEQYRGRTARFYNARTGEYDYAKFTDDDIGKAIYGNKKSDAAGRDAFVNTGADGGVFDLVENAKHDSYGKEKGKTTPAHKNVFMWDYYVKTVQIDGAVFDLVINVRQKADGEYVYSVQLNEDKNKTPAPILAPAYNRNSDMAKRENESHTDVSGINVSQDADVVKIEDAGIAIDKSGEAALPGRMSLKTWNQSNYVQTRDAAAAQLAKTLGVSEAEAKAYIDDINSIAKTVAEDKGRLDFEAADNQVMLKDNQEYVKTLDASTLCAKRLVYQGTFDAIQHRLPNTMLSSDDLIGLLNMMREHGVETPCGVCYVESRRRHLGKFAQDWLNGYRGEYIPKLDEVTTSDGLEALRHSHPQTYEDFMSVMSKKGSANPKVVQLRTEYRNEIMSLTRAQIRKIEAIGGLRVQSFSNFETPHLLDMMQAVMDMSAKNLHSQAYTKVPNFAWVFGNTGIKINLSLIAEGDGFDADGNLAFSSVEGMDFDEAMKLRDAYSDNVGTIIVGANDKHILACMADDRIDFIIPFHRSGWGKKELAMMGMDTYEDYTYGQNEHDLTSGKNVKNFYPHDYWDYSLSGKENAERYLNLCASTGREPKFSKFLVDNGDGSYSLQPDGSTDGYWKTLIDFKMYNNEGEGAPQQTVRPNFNMKEARRVLDEYEGGANNLPVANDVVEEFVSKYRAEHPQVEYSLKGGGELSEKVRRIREEGAAAGRSEADIQAEVRSVVDKVYQQMLTDFGAIEPGENAYREVQVPSRTAKKKKVSKTVRTAMEAQATPDEALPKMEELVATGEFSYEVYGDEAALKDAREYIQEKGWAGSLAEWLNDVRKGNVSKLNTAVGWLLYDNAVNRGDVETAMTILNAMVEHQRSAAQAVQATRLLKKLSPETRLYGVQRSIASLQREINDRHGKSKVELVIDQTLAEDFIRARTDEERDEALREIYRDIGRQMPSTFIDKFRAWRYLAMLGNPRTHGRNIAGNAAFAPVVLAKDITASAIEAAVYRVSGGRTGRSKTLSIKQGVMKAAWQDYKNVAEIVSGEGKYSDYANANRYIEEGRQVFKFAPLEKARRGNTKALEAEDMWFSQPHYAFALAQYCSINGISAEQIRSGKGLDKAREYAAREAQKATYRDTNQFSLAISHMGFKTVNGNMVKKGVNAALEGVLPFRKTPANILVRGLEYSPLGLLNGIKQAIWDVQIGNMTAAEAIDNISAGLTGTGLLALGVYLAAQGLIRGKGSDDENEKEFEELMGHQSYALETPDGKSYTLDWLAPEALPFFIGVNLYEQVTAKRESQEDMQFKDVMAAVWNVTEPMLSMSCLQSLNDLFEAVGYASSNDMNGLMTVLSTAATSYLSQALPTIAGQIERIGEIERMTTYTEKNSPFSNDMQYFFGRVSGKIPGEFQQIPYIDAWGRTEFTGGFGEKAFNNLLNPAYSSQIEMSAMEEMLLQLYNDTGEASVLPSRAGKYFNVGTTRKDLTAEEYVKYATEKGQLSYNLLTGMMASEVYMGLGSADQVDAVEKVYDYANAIAKTKVSDYKLDGWVAKANKAITETNVKPEVYIPLYIAQGNIESLKDKDGKTINNSKSLQVMQLVYATPGLTDKQRKALFEAFDVSESIRHYNRTLVEQKLREMQRKAK